MAKQCGHIFIQGKTANLCFYKMEGNYYVRRKSTLSGERVKRSAAFRRTRENAALLGLAARIASEVYRNLPVAERKHPLYRKITGRVFQLLRNGMNAEQALEQVQALYPAG